MFENITIKNIGNINKTNNISTCLTCTYSHSGQTNNLFNETFLDYFSVPD